MQKVPFSRCKSFNHIFQSKEYIYEAASSGNKTVPQTSQVTLRWGMDDRRPARSETFDPEGCSFILREFQLEVKDEKADETAVMTEGLARGGGFETGRFEAVARRDATRRRAPKFFEVSPTPGLAYPPRSLHCSFQRNALSLAPVPVLACSPCPLPRAALSATSEPGCFAIII